MGVGGATWDTAGTLEVGAGNTFTVADATEDPPFPGFEDAAWWTLTPASSSVIVLGHSDPSFVVLYKGADYDHRVEVPLDDFDGDAPVYTVQQGVTYHLLAGHDAFDSPTTYQITWTTRTIFSATPWLSTLRDRDDNFVIVSTEGYSLQTVDQPWEAWMEQVIRRTSGGGAVHSARVGTYGATEVLGGDDPNAAASCCWAHVLLGEVGAQLWNGGGGAGDTSSAVCRPLGAFPTGDGEVGDGTIGYTVHSAGDPIPFTARVESARIRLDGRAIYLRPIHDSLAPNGRLPLPNRAADGVPDDAVLEWETPLVDLRSAYYTVDSTFWPDEGEAGVDAITVSIAMRDVVRPSYNVAGEDYATWPAGTPGEWDETRDQYLYGQWLDGDRDWVEITGLIAGEDGTANLAELNGSDAPDENATIGPAQAWLILASPPPPGTYDREADVALKVYVRSPRYRWVYEGGTVPPRRIFGRSDGATHGAARIFGGGNTVQSGNRTLGGIL